MCRVNELETRADQLRAQIDAVELETSGQNHRDSETASVARDLEQIQTLCASLAQDRDSLRQRETAQREQCECVRQEKEQLVCAGEKEASQQRVKIRLLQEALTKRNEELAAVQNKNRELVPLL